MRSILVNFASAKMDRGEMRPVGVVQGSLSLTWGISNFIGPHAVAAAAAKRRFMKPVSSANAPFDAQRGIGVPGRDSLVPAPSRILAQPPEITNRLPNQNIPR